jgi:hypothetical protein
MGEAQALADLLMAAQNPDGGWAYCQGSSWAEPTSFALLALGAAQITPSQPTIKRGISWLLHAQSSSGGWPPNACVNECTSVASVATLALLNFAPLVPATSLDAAISWTDRQVYTDDFSLALLLSSALHVPPAHAPGSVPWYPGTAGWVTPTALTVLALSKVARERNRPQLSTTAIRACDYLVTRRCSDGGWNHGGSSARSENAISYPETTGLALLALRSAGVTPPPDAVTLGYKFAASPASVEGLAWLQLALGTPQERVPDPPVMPTPRTSRDVALRLLAVSGARSL